MSYIHLTYYSEAINGTTEVAVFYPYVADPDLRNKKGERNRTMGDPGPGNQDQSRVDAHSEIANIPPESLVYDKRKRYQVLYLISGGGGDYTDWPISAMIQSACLSAQLIVVMPTIRDFNEMQRGADYTRYISEELPKFVKFLFPISEAREDTFICGFSYGGYYAYYIALTHLEQYSCVASICSPLDVVADIRKLHSGHASAANADEVENTERDILWLTEKLKKEGALLPGMFQSVGTEDFTWDFNVTARKHFQKLGIESAWTQGPGTHGYRYATEHFQEVLDWLPLKNRSFIPD